MPESSGLALSLIVHWPYRLKTLIQRIIRGRRLTHDSKWSCSLSLSLPAITVIHYLIKQLIVCNVEQNVFHLTGRCCF